MRFIKVESFTINLDHVVLVEEQVNHNMNVQLSNGKSITLLPNVATEFMEALKDCDNPKTGSLLNR